jgi:hypothetical protein
VVDTTGSVGLALQIAPDITVSSASYSVFGPNGYTTSGTVPVGSNSNVAVVLNGVPIGTGYTMNVSALASDGVTACTGAATFDVQDSVTSTIVVHLVCRQPPGTGKAAIDSTLNVCPLLESLDAIPAEALVGGILSLDAVAHDADQGPTAMTYTWTVDGVAVVGSAPHLAFTCPSAANFELAVTVADGDPNPACADKLSVSVTCTGGL